MTARMWAALAELIDQPQLIDYFPSTEASDRRLESRDKLDRLIEEWASAHSEAEVVSAMHRIGVPCSPVNSLERVTRDAHVLHRRMIRSIPHESGSGTVQVAASPLAVADAMYEQAPPSVGQHTQEILGIRPDTA